MPLGQRIAHVAPERPRCIRDLLGELLVSAGDVLPKVKASEIRVVALPGGISDPTEDAGELAETVSPALERLGRRLERLSPQCPAVVGQRWAGRRLRTLSEMWAGLVARPGAGDLLEGTRAASVDRCLREPEERALERGGSQELTPTVFALLWLRRVFLVRDALPHLLEDGAREKSAEHAEEQSEGPVGKFRHAPAPYPVQSQPNAPCSVFVCSEGEQPLSKHETKGVTVEGMRDKVEGKVKETEGKLTDDELREKQGEAQQKVGEGKEQLEDAKDEARERI